jgi:exodeoxyribonuclease VII large subunit
LSSRVRRERTELRRMPALLTRLALHSVQRKRAELSAFAARLNALSPLAVLGRGYAVAKDNEGRALTSAREFTDGMEFQLLMRDGEIDAVVKRERQ